MIFIVVKFTIRPEYSDQWLDRVSGFTQATRQEPGNLWFEWSRSADNPDQFVLLEAFRDAAAGAEHVSSEHFKSAIREQPALLAKVPEIINVEVPGTEWSELAEMS
jgi:quinol monooxygenase YgiN